MISKEALDKAFDSRFPLEIKEKLLNSRVAIAGLGGLGSNIAIMLARTGVGHMLLVDYDIVDITNLNRQIYDIDCIGRNKTDCIKDIINKINPYLDITVMNQKVNKDNLKALFIDYPIVCEAFDKPEEKAMLVNGLLLECKDTIIVSGNGMAGFEDSNNIHTTKKLSRLYVCGDETTDIGDGLGLMAPRVAICAGHQANKVVQLILEK